jgi:hypothetical protein
MLYAICIASLEPQHPQTANSDKQQNKKQEQETSKLKLKHQTSNPTHHHHHDHDALALALEDALIEKREAGLDRDRASGRKEREKQRGPHTPKPKESKEQKYEAHA